MRKRVSISPFATASAQLQVIFLSLLPIIERVASFRFRHLERHHDHEDAVAEVIGLCWLWFVRLAKRKRDARRFPTTLANLASRSVKSGRRLCGTQSGKDALSETARQRRGFHVEQLQDRGVYGDADWQEALTDNMQTPPPDAAAFRLDFAAWLCRLQEWHRRIVRTMAQGERTLNLARRFGVSPARISQLRSAYHTDWLVFQGDALSCSC